MPPDPQNSIHALLNLSWPLTQWLTPTLLFASKGNRYRDAAAFMEYVIAVYSLALLIALKYPKIYSHNI